MLKRAVKHKRRIAAGRTGSVGGKEEYGLNLNSKKHHCVLNTCTHSKRTVLQQAIAGNRKERQANQGKPCAMLAGSSVAAWYTVARVATAGANFDTMFFVASSFCCWASLDSFFSLAILMSARHQQCSAVSVNVSRADSYERRAPSSADCSADSSICPFCTAKSLRLCFRFRLRLPAPTRSHFRWRSLAASVG